MGVKNGYSIKDTDENYLTDFNQINELNLHISETYWLASREWRGLSSWGNVRYVVNSSVRNHSIYYNSFDYGIKSHEYTDGIRPVFTLKSNVKVTGGAGTSTSPYTLGV